mgnify:FL=1
MTENRTEMKRREYLIGDMSEIVGISRDTLRFYEKKGIIKSRKRKMDIVIIWKKISFGLCLLYTDGR